MALELGPVHPFAAATSGANDKRPARVRRRSRPQRSRQSSPSSEDELGTGPENEADNVDELDADEENGDGPGSDGGEREEGRKGKKVSANGKNLSASLAGYGSDVSE